MKKRVLKRRYGHGARRDAKDELYEVGATHAAFGDEGMREYRGTQLVLSVRRTGSLGVAAKDGVRSCSLSLACT